jgi:hypothetical protein
MGVVRCGERHIVLPSWVTTVTERAEREENEKGAGELPLYEAMSSGASLEVPSTISCSLPIAFLPNVLAQVIHLPEILDEMKRVLKARVGFCIQEKWMGNHEASSQQAVLPRLFDLGPCDIRQNTKTIEPTTGKFMSHFRPEKSRRLLTIREDPWRISTNGES